MPLFFLAFMIKMPVFTLPILMVFIYVQPLLGSMLSFLIARLNKT